MGKLNRYFWFLIMIIIGAGVGLYYSWFANPPDFIDAVFVNLRQDYKTDYVLMVAEIYDQDHNRLEANRRLDDLLDMNESKEELVHNMIRNAENAGYAPVDLEKMNQLVEVITGLRPTPTPVTDATMVYNLAQTSQANTAVPDTGSGGTADSSSGDPSLVQPDADPFGTGIRITTDPNAVPELNLPPAPTITPNAGVSWPDDSSASSGSTGSSSGGSDNFGGLPDSFFD